MKYAVTGLPRSRTKWASVFLSTPDIPCIHSVDPRKVMEVNDNYGISDPSVLYHWEKIPENVPIVYINRPIQEVKTSLYGLDVSTDLLQKLVALASEMITERDVLVLPYHGLDAHALWGRCHGSTITDDYVKVFEDMNITQQAVETLRRVI